MTELEAARRVVRLVEEMLHPTSEYSDSFRGTTRIRFREVYKQYCTAAGIQPLKTAYGKERTGGVK